MGNPRTPSNQAFSREALELFARLDATPARQRNGDEFREGEKRLMCKLLDLVSEFWMMQSPLDRSRRPCHPPTVCAFEAWHTCRSYREEMLAALGLKKSPAAKRGKANNEDAQPSHRIASNASPSRSH
jgi:hypothetical protein